MVLRDLVFRVVRVGVGGEFGIKLRGGVSRWIHKLGRFLWINVREWCWVDVFCDGIAVMVGEVFRYGVVFDWFRVSRFRRRDEALGHSIFDNRKGGRRGRG